MKAVGIKYIRGVTYSASFAGTAMPAPENGRLSLYIEWTSNLAGTFSLETRAAGGAWAVPPGSADQFTTQPNGSNATTAPLVCNWSNLPGDEWRLVFTRSGGTGAVTVNASQGDVWNG